MFDNQLIALIINTIIAGESTAGIAGTPIKQAFQPTNQGINTGPTAYLHKISDHRAGYPYWSDVWDKISETMVHQNLQQYETTFQISALSTQDPANTSQYTASDILNLIASILQSSEAVITFAAQGVGIERVTALRNTYFKDDRERFEASPSFDFVMAHKQVITSTSPIIEKTTINIIKV